LVGIKSCTPIGLNPGAYHVASKSRGPLRNGGFSRGAAHQNASLEGAVSSMALWWVSRFSSRLVRLEMAGYCKQITPTILLDALPHYWTRLRENLVYLLPDLLAA
jgi:hypothetical protein